MTLPLFDPTDPWTVLIDYCATQIAAVEAGNLPSGEKTRIVALINADLAIYQSAQTAYVTAIKTLLDSSGGGNIGGTIAAGQVAIGASTIDTIQGGADLVFVGQGNTNAGLGISNSTAGASASVGIALSNDLGHHFNVAITSSTTSGDPDIVKMSSNAANGIDISDIVSFNGLPGSTNDVLTKQSDGSWKPASAAGGGTITDWTSVSPIPWTSGSNEAPTLPLQNNLAYRRVGDSMEIRLNLLSDGGGVNASGNIGFPIPAGLHIDTTKILLAGADPVGVGQVGWAYVTGQSGPLAIFPLADSSTEIAFWCGSFVGALTGIAPLSDTQFPFNNGAGQICMSVFLSVPILEWA